MKTVEALGGFCIETRIAQLSEAETCLFQLSEMVVAECLVDQRWHVFWVDLERLRVEGNGLAVLAVLELEFSVAIELVDSEEAAKHSEHRLIMDKIMKSAVVRNQVVLIKVKR